MTSSTTEQESADARDFTAIKPGDDLWLSREHVEGLLKDIEALRLQKIGLEALLCDAQAEIGDLGAKLDRAYAALRPFAEACNRAREHTSPLNDTVEVRFRHAEGGAQVFIWDMDVEDFARAADELFPEKP